ncbi:MAG: hypothetical protein ACLP0J_08790 [Solirubrobacteraceae bacterium]
MADENLDSALEKLAGKAADREGKAQRQPTPVRPDPELDELFRDFAKRMPRETALPFVKDRYVTVRVRRGWFSKPIDERRNDPVELARGWPVLGNEFGMGEERASGNVRDWSGLAVATDGSPWFVVRSPLDAPSLTVAGKPKGPSLRASIISKCKLEFYDGDAPLEVHEGPNFRTVTRAPAHNPSEQLVSCLAEALAAKLFVHGVRAEQFSRLPRRRTTPARCEHVRQLLATRRLTEEQVAEIVVEDCVSDENWALVRDLSP